MSKTAESPAQTPTPGGSPAVLASSRLCELMEQAAARLMRPHLRDGESSFAVVMTLSHVVAGFGRHGPVRVSASHHAVAGRLHRFTVNAFDERGLVAVGEHTRAVVNDQNFMATARRRAGKPSMQMRA